MQKLHKLFLLILSVILVVSYQPAPTYGAESATVNVIIGYENSSGKQLIIDNSSEIEYQSNHVKVMAVTLDSSSLKKLSKSPNITYIEKNIRIDLSNLDDDIVEKPIALYEDSRQWNIQSISGPVAWEQGFTGKNVNIAVIDTGIAPHPDLEVAGGTSTVDGVTEWTDDNGHGTHVAGIIGAERNNLGVVGVAPDANIYAVKALDSNGEGTLDDLLEAIEWSIQNDMDIINLSLGTDFNSQALKDIINKAYNAGILIVSASGNGGKDTPVMYPAKYENVIGVSAVNETFEVTPFSSTGPAVEFSAPGKNIISTYLNNSYGVADGTSQAAPHVAGMLALLMEKFPGKTATELRTELVSYTQDLGVEGRDNLYGHGFVNYLPDLLGPGEVTNVKAGKITTKSFFVSWEMPVDEDFAKLYLYLNGKLVHEFTDDALPGFTFKNLKPDTEYTLSFYTVDRFGNQSKGITHTVKTLPVEVVVAEPEPEVGKEQPANDPGKEVKEESAPQQEEDEQVKPKDEEREDSPQSSVGADVAAPEAEDRSPEGNAVNQPDEGGMVITVPGPVDPKPEENEADGDKTSTSEGESEEKNNSTPESKPKEDTVESAAVKDEPKEKSESGSKEKDDGIISKFFGFIAKIFISITDWLVGLF